MRCEKQQIWKIHVHSYNGVCVCGGESFWVIFHGGGG